MKPRKEIVDKAYKDGAIDKAALMLALSYVTLSAANNFIDEANDYIEPYGLKIGELKMAHNNFMKSADRYFKACLDMFSKDCSAIDYFSDLESLEKAIKEWSGVEDKLKKIDDETARN